MHITKHLAHGVCDITLSGNFTFNDYNGFRDVLETIPDDNVRQLVLHMQGIDFLDSAAMGMLLLAHEETQKHQKTFAVRGAAGQVKKMLSLAKFDTLFSIN